MNVECIFGIEIPQLFAVKFENCSHDEFTKTFDLWTDVEFLFNFFSDHENELKYGYYKGISIDDAIEKTIDYAEDLEDKLFQLAQNPNTFSRELLNLFKPLNNYSYQLTPLQKSKAKNNWLRIYAIKLGNNRFIITGGAIKLTKDMTPNHLAIELHKLEQTKLYLKDIGVLDDEDDFEYYQLGDYG